MNQALKTIRVDKEMSDQVEIRIMGNERQIEKIVQALKRSFSDKFLIVNGPFENRQPLSQRYRLRAYVIMKMEDAER